MGAFFRVCVQIFSDMNFLQAWTGVHARTMKSDSRSSSPHGLSEAQRGREFTLSFLFFVNEPQRRISVEMINRDFHEESREICGSWDY